MTMGSPAVTITDGVAVEVRPHPGWGVSDDCFKAKAPLVSASSLVQSAASQPSLIPMPPNREPRRGG